MSFHNLDFFLGQAVQLIYQRIDLIVRRVDLALNQVAVMGGVSRRELLVRRQHLVDELLPRLRFFVGGRAIQGEIGLEMPDELIDGGLGLIERDRQSSIFRVECQQYSVRRGAGINDEMKNRPTSALREIGR